MGCQVGDLNMDGTPDIYIGNGGPLEGTADQLYLSIPDSLVQPRYQNHSSLIDFPARETSRLEYPSYPYRTHGTAMVDVNGDGRLEIAVANGGPAAKSDQVQEPNRLFSFSFPERRRSFVVRLHGDGVNVSRDAVGTRVVVRAIDGDGNPRIVHRTLFAGSAFSAQNGFDLHFGLGDAVSIERVDILWPNGVSESLTEGLIINSSLLVEY